MKDFTQLDSNLRDAIVQQICDGDEGFDGGGGPGPFPAPNGYNTPYPGYGFTQSIPSSPLSLPCE